MNSNQSLQGSKVRHLVTLLVIIIVALFVAFMLGVAALFVWVGNQTHQTAATQPVQTLAVAETPTQALPEVSLPDIAPEAPAAQLQERNAPAQPTATTTEPAPQPQAPYEADMIAAGISAADQPIVRAMVLPNGEWDYTNLNPNVSTRVMFNKWSKDYKARFVALNYYVVSAYGSWAEAQAHYSATGKW